MRIEFPKEHIVHQEPKQDLLANILSYKKLFMWLFIGASMLSVVTTYIFSNKQKAYKEYAKVEQTIGNLKFGQEIDEKLVENLQGVISLHPELASRMEGVLAQHFLCHKDLEKADKYAQSSFKRLAFADSYYTTFARNSLVIEDKAFDRALALSQELYQKMRSDTSWMTEDFGNLLVGFNLVRIATLHKILGNIAEEKVAIADVKNLLTSANGKILLRHFSEQDISILDYFALREVELS